MTQPQPNVHHETAHFSLPTDSGLQLDVKNGSDSTVGDGFDLAPSSMAYPSVNCDSHFNPYPQLKKMVKILLVGDRHSFKFASNWREKRQQCKGLDNDKNYFCQLGVAMSSPVPANGEEVTNRENISVWSADFNSEDPDLMIDCIDYNSILSSHSGQ
ncbi:hypothetical protein CFP56_005487 [Quercus suber]|uniref:Uncharacterized protein n=1 Tax=Quercus suber TaxID=58331 RepID=A0AAW0IGF5_QUESU